MPDKDIVTKSSRVGTLSRLLPLFPLILFLNGCAKTVYEVRPDITLPRCPVAGEKVADELGRACYPEKQNLCPHMWHWLDRVDKLCRKLSVKEGVDS